MKLNATHVTILGSVAMLVAGALLYTGKVTISPDQWQHIVGALLSFGLGWLGVKRPGDIARLP